MKLDEIEDNQQKMPRRWLDGEGWYICNACGVRLGSFDLKEGEYKDVGLSCPDNCREGDSP